MNMLVYYPYMRVLFKLKKEIFIIFSLSQEISQWLYYFRDPPCIKYCI